MADERSSEITALGGFEDGAGAVADVELGEDAGDVVLHGALGDVEGARDLAVRVAGGEQAEDLALAGGDRFGGAVALGLARRRAGGDAAARLLAERGREHGSAGGERAHRREQPLERHVLEQVAPGAALDRAQGHRVVVERGEHQGGDGGAAAGQLVEHPEAVAAGHADVEEQHVRRGLEHLGDRLLAARRLADQLDVAGQLEQAPQADAHDRVVVGEHDADHDAGSSGSEALTAKAGVVTIARRPPTSSIRARMPASPWPRRSSGAPRPSSRASTVIDEAERSTRIHSVLAPAWRQVLVRTSWTQRTRQWARAAHSTTSGSGSSRWTRRPGVSAHSSRSARPTSGPVAPRSAETAWRRPPSASSTSARARRRCGVARSGATFFATSSWRPSAVRPWPSTSWRSRAMRSRSSARLVSASNARVASSSALDRASAARASASRRASTTATAAAAWKPLIA